MTEAAEIVVTLNNRGMHDRAIGAAIGVTRQTICKIRNGQQNGERSLPALRKLLAVSLGEAPAPSFAPAPRSRKQREDREPEYIEAEVIEAPARSSDVAPTVEETVIELPRNYALTRTVAAPESQEYKQWKRQQAAYARYQREQAARREQISSYASTPGPLFLLVRALFAQAPRPAAPQQLPSRAASLQSDTPRPVQSGAGLDALAYYGNMPQYQRHTRPIGVLPHPTTQPALHLALPQSSRYVDTSAPRENEQRPNNPLSGK